MENTQKKVTPKKAAPKKRKLKNSLVDMSFIGEEIQAFSINRAKQGKISKADLTDLLRIINHRAWKLTKIAKDLQKDYNIV